MKNVNPNGGNVVASNLNNVKFLFFENIENWVHIQTLHVDFSKRCHDCLKNHILHIVHLTNQHQMKQSFHA
jgi:hypothetical protein